MNARIKLNVRKSKETANGHPIIIYVTQNYEEKEWRTGFYSKKSQWNNQLASPKRNHPQFYPLVHYLGELKKRLDEVQVKSAIRNMTMEEIKKDLFNTRTDRFYYTVMNSFAPDYRGTDWSALQAFQKRHTDAHFDSITPKVAHSFKKYLLDKGHKPSGVDSYIRSLRALWNKHSIKPNPFANISIEIPDTINPVASTKDLQILKNTSLDSNSAIGGNFHFRNYWLLMFYLGGIDTEVLAKLRYDEHVIDGRINFNRNKGRSKTRCSNIILTEAKQILKEYKKECYPYLVPIHKSSNYKTFSGNYSRRMKELSQKLDLSTKLKPKSARYTFIDRAQQLLVDERITAQIVGHRRKTTTSIYTNDFPLKIQDENHLKIISLS